MDATATGGCACGAIRYEFRGEPVFSFQCHCRHCQRATGSGHASAFIIDEGSLDVSGEIKFFERGSEAGNTVRQGFCPKCGSPVLNKNSGYPDSRYIHAATLDDPSLFSPQKAIFSDSAQPWDTVKPD